MRFAREAGAVDPYDCERADDHNFILLSISHCCGTLLVADNPLFWSVSRRRTAFSLHFRLQTTLCGRQHRFLARVSRQTVCERYPSLLQVKQIRSCSPRRKSDLGNLSCGHTSYITQNRPQTLSKARSLLSRHSCHINESHKDRLQTC